MKLRSLFYQSAEPRSMLGYIKLCHPILLFPLLYFPYTLFWRRGFAPAAVRLLGGSEALRVMVTGNNTVLLFWCLVTAVVMLVAAVIAVFRVRPWYASLVYTVVMFSLCGILSLFFYTTTIR